MKTDFEKILETFSEHARAEVELEASKRGCSALELLVKLADRYLADRRYKRKFDRLLAKVRRRYAAGKDAIDIIGHLDTLDAIMLQFMLKSRAEPLA